MKKKPRVTILSGNPKSPQATVSGHIVNELDNFAGFKYYQTLFGVNRDLSQELPKMGQKFLSDPQKPHIWAEISASVPLKWLKMTVEILHKVV